jgi:hypothetical protein
MKALRWLLVLPSMATGLLAGATLAFAIVWLGEWTCPEEHVVSNHCFAPWTDFVYYTALCFGAGVAGGLTVLFAALLAPTQKRVVAHLAFAIGIVATVHVIYMEVFSRGFEVREWDAFTYVFFFSAAIAIGAGYWVINLVRRYEVVPWLWQESRSVRA